MDYRWIALYMFAWGGWGLLQLQLQRCCVSVLRELDDAESTCKMLEPFSYLERCIHSCNV
jgi:hypothetical protein